MVFEQLTNSILTFVNYGITILVLLLFWEIFQIAKHLLGGSAAKVGEKLSEPFRKLPERGLLGDLKQTGEDIKKLVVGAEKSLFSEWVAEKKEVALLDEVRKEIDAKSGPVIIRKKVEAAKKQLNRRVGKFTKRMEKYTKRLTEAGKKIKGFDVNTLDAERTKIMTEHQKVDQNLDNILKARSLPAMKRSIADAITAENEVLRLLRGLLAFEKSLLESIKT